MWHAHRFSFPLPIYWFHYLSNASTHASLSCLSFRLLLATRAERDPKTNQYTDRASDALEDVAGYIRLFHALMWASFTKKFKILLTPKGLSRILSRGVMTRSQYDCLVGIRPNTSGPQDAALQWIYIRIVKGMEEGAFPQTPTMESMCTAKLLDLRRTMGGVGDSLDGKIPLSYAQFVLVLVDIFLVLSPFALYPELGMWRYVCPTYVDVECLIYMCVLFDSQFSPIQFF